MRTRPPSESGSLARFDEPSPADALTGTRGETCAHVRLAASRPGLQRAVVLDAPLRPRPRPPHARGPTCRGPAVPLQPVPQQRMALVLQGVGVLDPYLVHLLLGETQLSCQL